MSQKTITDKWYAVVVPMLRKITQNHPFKMSAKISKVSFLASDK
jgi:hypothetical protein